MRNMTRIDQSIITDLHGGFKGVLSEMPEKTKSLQRNPADDKETWGAEAPHAKPRFSRMHPIMTCTERQVGCRS